MVSDTSKTESRRRRKRSAAGKARKKALEKEGTTPSFPIHPKGKAAPTKPATK
jgi:hypothetical protein